MGFLIIVFFLLIHGAWFSWNVWVVIYTWNYSLNLWGSVTVVEVCDACYASISRVFVLNTEHCWCLWEIGDLLISTTAYQLKSLWKDVIGIHKSIHWLPFVGVPYVGKEKKIAMLT